MVEALNDLPDVPLVGAEQEIVANAVEVRRREFATARHCARAALKELGVPPVPIGRRQDRSPIWPPGIAGSITHCEGYRAAAVARSAEWEGIGIDAEPDGPLPEETCRLILRVEERAHVEDLSSSRPGHNWDRLISALRKPSSRPGSP